MALCYNFPRFPLLFVKSIQVTFIANILRTLTVCIQHNGFRFPKRHRFRVRSQDEDLYEQ